MERLKTNLQVEIDGINIEYGMIPSGLIESWDGIVYYFKTNTAYDVDSHEWVVSKVINQLQNQNSDHQSEWRRTKIEAVVWNEDVQITLVSFRIKDSY